MKEIINDYEDMFADMQSKGLVSTGSQWIEKAIKQKSNKLTVAVADSRLLTYDSVDRILLSQLSSN